MWRGAESRPSSSVEPRVASVRPRPWGIYRKEGRRLLIGTMVPYCGYSEPMPSIQRVERRRIADGVVLRILVRFPVVKAAGCVGFELGLLRWVEVGDLEGLRVFDGSTAPPRRRF